MFSQKKKFPWGWTAVIIVLIAIGILLLMSVFTEESNSPKDNIEPSYTTDSEMEGTAQTIGPSMEQPEEEKSNSESYYLVKNDNNIIKVYFYDTQGKCTLLEETNIMYEILSEVDQSRFDTGVKLSSREELNKLIMDYES